MVVGEDCEEVPVRATVDFNAKCSRIFWTLRSGENNVWIDLHLAIPTDRTDRSLVCHTENDTTEEVTSPVIEIAKFIPLQLDSREDTP
jgi:hypothetical protein